MLRKGEKIGEYVLLDKVGSGGFGDVWKAEKRTRVDVNYFALKFFRPKDDGFDFEKISKEINVWKQLRGLPHIISVIELDQFDDYVYVVSDFAEGGSLQKWLKANGGKARTVEEAVGIALEVLNGLDKLHRKGFVHRDLKPDNILIMNGYHCLADFGISREIKSHSKATGTAGTMEYMPPEAFAKRASITRQTDIWAVGVVLQKLLTGELPYPQDDQPSLIAAILYSAPEEMPRSISGNLRAIVEKALQKRREDRFQSATEMFQALQAASIDETRVAMAERDTLPLAAAETAIDAMETEWVDAGMALIETAGLPAGKKGNAETITERAAGTEASPTQNANAKAAPADDPAGASAIPPLVDAVAAAVPIQRTEPATDGLSRLNDSGPDDDHRGTAAASAAAKAVAVESRPKRRPQRWWIITIAALSVLALGASGGLILFNTVRSRSANNDAPNVVSATPTPVVVPVATSTPSTKVTPTPLPTPSSTPTEDGPTTADKHPKPTGTPVTVKTRSKAPVPNRTGESKTTRKKPSQDSDCIFNGRC